MESRCVDVQLTQWEYLISHTPLNSTIDSQNSNVSESPFDGESSSGRLLPSSSGSPSKRKVLTDRTKLSLEEGEFRYIEFKRKRKVEFYGDSEERYRYKSRKKNRLHFETSQDTPPRELKHNSLKITDLDNIKLDFKDDCIGNKKYSILCIVLQTMYQSENHQRLLVGDVTAPHIILDLWSATARKFREQEIDAGDILYITRIVFKKVKGILRGVVSAGFQQQSKVEFIHRIGDTEERNKARINSSCISIEYHNTVLRKVKALIDWIKREKGFLYSHIIRDFSKHTKTTKWNITKLSLINQDDSTTETPVPVQLWDEHASDASRKLLNGLVGSFIVCKFMKPQFSLAFDAVSLHSTTFTEILPLGSLSKENPQLLETLNAQFPWTRAPANLKKKYIICDTVKSLLELNIDGIFEAQLSAFIGGVFGLSKAKLCCRKCNQIAATENSVLCCPSSCHLTRNYLQTTKGTGPTISSPKERKNEYDYSFDFGKLELMSREEPPISGFKWLVQPFKIILCDSKEPLYAQPQLQVDVGIDAIPELLFLSDQVLSSDAIARCFENSLVKETKTKFTFLLQGKLISDQNGFRMRQKSLFKLISLDF